MEEEKRIQIDPIPEPEKGKPDNPKESEPEKPKRKPGRPRLPDDQKKYPKKTEDKYTMTDKRKKALEKARMVKQLRKEGKIVNTKNDPVVNYNPDIVNSEYGEYPSAINSNPKSQKPIATEPVRYLNNSENKMYIHEANYAQQPYGSQGNVDLFSIYSSQIEELKMQIEELKKTKQMAPSLKIQNEIDDQGINETYRIKRTETKHDKGDIKTYSGRKNTTNNIYNPNPFAVSKRKRK